MARTSSTTLPLLLCMSVSLAGGVDAAERSSAQPGCASSALEFVPGVIVDPVRGAVYSMNPQGGIDAVELASGRLFWQTEQAAKPLAYEADLLVAQTEPRAQEPVLRIALLSTREVGGAPRFVDVPLPEGVRATVDREMESSFSASARIRNGSVALSWRYSYERVSGPPTEPGGQASDRELNGQLLIDLESGRISDHETEPCPEPVLPESVTRFRDAQDPRPPIHRAGDVLASIERETHERGQRVTLRRWDAVTGEALAVVELFHGELGFRTLSADGRHLLASRRNTTDASLWHWVVFSLQTGAKLAELQQDTAAARFLVNGSVLLRQTNPTRRNIEGRDVVVPGRLRAIDLDTGAELWSRAIRDTEYRGAYPP